MGQDVVKLASDFKCVLLLNEELLGKVRIDIEVAGAAENARSGFTEIHLHRSVHARGRIVGLELAGGEARRSASAVYGSADRIDVGVDDGGKRGRTGSTAGVDLRGDLAVGRREVPSRVDIRLQAEIPAAQHRIEDSVRELVRLGPDQVAHDGVTRVEARITVAKVQVVRVIDRGEV